MTSDSDIENADLTIKPIDDPKSFHGRITAAVDIEGEPFFRLTVPENGLWWTEYADEYCEDNAPYKTVWVRGEYDVEYDCGLGDWVLVKPVKLWKREDGSQYGHNYRITVEPPLEVGVHLGWGTIDNWYKPVGEDGFEKIPVLQPRVPEYPKINELITRWTEGQCCHQAYEDCSTDEPAVLYRGPSDMDDDIAFHAHVIRDTRNGRVIWRGITGIYAPYFKHLGPSLSFDEKEYFEAIKRVRGGE